MTSSLSNLINDFAEGIHNTECKYRHNHKKWETCGIKYKDRDYFLEYTNSKNDLIEYKCLCYKKDYRQKFDEN